MHLFVDPEGAGAKTQYTIIAVCIVLGLVCFSAVLVVTIYIIRKKKQNKAEALQSKLDYKYEMSMYNKDPPQVDCEDLTLANCIHKGRFGDVSVKC